MKASIAGYARARSLPEVFDLLEGSGGSAQVIAGGQSLVATLNLRLAESVRLVDLGEIEALRGVSEADGMLRIGAMTRHAEIAASELVARKAPLLTEAVPLIAHAAIRNRGTIGGSLAHADPAAELPACLVALGAVIEVRAKTGARRIQAVDFIEGIFATALEEGEIITAIEVPVLENGERHAIRELTRRSGDYALVGLAGVRRQENVRLSYFGIGDGPVLAEGAMKVLSGGGSIAEARAALAQDLDPQSDLHATGGYRMHLAGVLLERVMNDLAGDAAAREAV